MIREGARADPLAVGALLWRILRRNREKSPTPAPDLRPLIERADDLRRLGLDKARSLELPGRRPNGFVCSTIETPDELTARGFEVLPRGWVIERSFAWLSRNRRLAKDFERLIEVSTAMVAVAIIQLLLRRLAGP